MATTLPNSVQEFIQQARKLGLESFGLYYGRYRATVTNIKDPKKSGYIKVSCPQLSGVNVIDKWIPPISQISGDGFGQFWIPPVGSAVMLTFENGNPQYPMWEGGSWKKGQSPEPARVSPPKVRVFESEKWRIEFDDQDSGKLQLSRKSNGDKILIDEATGNVEISCSGKMKVNATGNIENTTAANKTETATGTHTTSSIGAMSFSSPAGIGFTVGGLTMDIATGSISLTGPGGHSIVINSSGVIIDGDLWDSHAHTGVIPGGGTSGGVA